MATIHISLSCPFSLSMKKNVEDKFHYKNGLMAKENYLWVSNIFWYILSDTKTSIFTAKSLCGPRGVLAAFFF